MKLKEYIEQLQKFVEMNPETLEMDVIYSRDDEGNGFQEVHYAPSKGFYEDMEFEESDYHVNAVCIN
jgi:hypothetical protein